MIDTQGKGMQQATLVQKMLRKKLVFFYTNLGFLGFFPEKSTGYPTNEYASTC